MAGWFAPTQLPVFVRTPGEEYACGKCCRILLPPVWQSQCGHRLCHGCVDRMFETQSSTPCPVAEDEACGMLRRDQMHQDHGMVRDLKKLLVYCQHREKGCHSTMKWELLQNHLTQCGFHSRTTGSEACVINPGVFYTIKRLEKEQGHSRTLLSQLRRNEANREQVVSSIQESVDNIGRGLTEVKRDVKELEEKGKKAEEEIQGLKTHHARQMKALETNHVHQIKVLETNHAHKIQILEMNHARLAIQVDRMSRDFEIRFQRLSLSSSAFTLSSKVIEIGNYSEVRANAKLRDICCLHSQSFYLRGYKFCVRFFANGKDEGKDSHVSLFFVLMKGDYDYMINWPFDKTVTLTIKARNRSFEDISCVTNSAHDHFDKPVPQRGMAFGSSRFALQSQIEAGGYILNDTLTVEVSVQDKVH